MTPEKLIAHFGSPREAASAIGMTPQIVTYWRRRGRIPWRTQTAIQWITGGRLRADRQNGRAK